MLRILLAIFLLIPMPVLAQDVPGEVTVNEAFDDSTYETGLTISGGSSDAYIYCSEQGRYGTTGCSLAINNGTYVFEFSEDVYEVGFIVGAVNNSYDVKYYYSDSTDETIQKSAQSWGTDGNDMYDNFYKSFTDYNNDEANTDKYITKFEVTISDISVLDTLYWQYVDESTIPTTTTSTTTTTTTTSTTTTTTVPPTTTTTTTTTVPPPPPPPPPPPEPVKVVMDDGSVAEYTEAQIEQGDVERDNQRKANEEKYGCYMTDAQIERGDCDIPEEEPVEEVIIVVDEEPDTKEELSDDDDMVLEVEPKDEVEDIEPIKEEDIVEEEVKIDVEKLEEEFAIEEEVIELPEIIIVEEIVEDELDKEIPGDDIIREETVQEEDVKDQVVQEVEVPVEVIVVEEVTEEQVEEVQAVVNTAIENVEELTEEQVEVVAEVLQVSTEDVEIIAEAVKTDEVVAEAVEVYVERAVANKDVENYTLADVVTEIQFENFIENPIEVLVDFDNINLSNIGDDMTQDQKEKAQEVVVPVILTRIATMAAFVFRRSL